MTSLTLGIIGIGVFIALMCIGVPIPFAMGLVGFIGSIIMKSPAAAAQILVGEFQAQFTSYALTVSSMFGMMGFLASYTGLGKELYTVVNKFLGHLRGGLAMATQVACAFFGAICGSPPATIGTFCAISYPEMVDQGYDRGFAAAAVASGAQISSLIPPSNTFVIFCLAAEVSVGKQFIAGVIPGVLLTVFNVLAIVLYLKAKPELAPTSAKSSWKERFAALKNKCVIQIVIVFLLSMGGLFAGLFTPSEAGAVGAFGMLIVTLFGRQVNWKKFMNACLSAVEMQTMVIVLLAFANVFSRFIAMSGLPKVIGNYCKSLLERGVSQYVLLLVIVFIFFILGMLMDLISVMLMTIPIFYPIIVDTIGYSPLWYGVIMTTLICLGGISPPMGASVFMARNACKDPKLSLASAFKSSLPFFASFLLVCVLLVFIPGLATWLPGLMK